MMTKRSNHMPMLMKMQRTKMMHGLRADLLEPERTAGEHVAADHREVGPPVRAERAVDERELLVQVARVPGDEELDRVRETDHHAGREHDLVHHLEVLLLDDVLAGRTGAAAAASASAPSRSRRRWRRRRSTAGRSSCASRAAARSRSRTRRPSAPRARAASRARRGSGTRARSGASGGPSRASRATSTP